MLTALLLKFISYL